MMNSSYRAPFVICLALSVNSACDRPAADSHPPRVTETPTKVAPGAVDATASEEPSNQEVALAANATDRNIGTPTLADGETDSTNSSESAASDESLANDSALTEFEDPAFDAFVDLKLVRKAVYELDAGLLVDVMLQTAEGEQVLGRERVGFSSQTLFDVALRVASESGDKTSLARLAKAAQKLGKPDLVAPIEMALKLADAPRKVDPGPKVPLRELTPEAMVLFKTFVHEIKICRACGDRRGLENLRVTIVQLDGLHPRQQEYLTEKLIDGLAAVPAEPDASKAALTQLAGVARRSAKPNADVSGQPELRPEQP